MLNITVQVSRIAVLAILISQGDSVSAQHCEGGSCCLKSRQGQLTAPTPRRSSASSLARTDRSDSFGLDRGVVERQGDEDLRSQYPAMPTGYRFGRASMPSIPVWESNIQKGAALARESGRPMLIRVTADWCGYCRKMKSEVFSQAGIQRDLVRGFVTVELDADKNRELVQRLGIKSLPATIILAPDMKIAERMEGFRSAQQLQVKLNRFLPRAELQREIEVALR